MLSIGALVGDSLAPLVKCGMAANKKNKPLKPWQKEDAKHLKKIFEQKVDGLNQEDFGARYGLGSQGNVWQYLNGRISLNQWAAIKFAYGLRCAVSEFSPTLAAEIAEIAPELAKPFMDDKEAALLLDYRSANDVGQQSIIATVHSLSKLHPSPAHVIRLEDKRKLRQKFSETSDFSASPGNDEPT